MEIAVAARGITIAAAGDPARQVVRDASFSLAAGRALGIAGESGSGKTALIQALFGYMRPGLVAAGGTVDYASARAGRFVKLPIGQPRAFAAVRGRVVAMIPQSPSAMLDPIMTVGKQLLEVAPHRAAVLAGLADVGFADPARIFKRYPHQLSGGQRQRVAISMALLLSPDVLVLDEATTDLDVVTQRTILDLLQRLRARHGFALIAVSHDLRVLHALCDELLVLHGGRVMETGPFDTLMQRPRHPYTARLVDRFLAGPLAGARQEAALAPIGTAGCGYLGHCALATAQCEAEPPLAEIGPGHASRCWFHARVGLGAARAAAAASLVRPGAPVLTVAGLDAAHREPGLLARRRVQVLHELSITVNQGECLAIVGESGSGKSTLARVIVGLHPPERGKLEFEGERLAPRAAERKLAVRRGLQIVFQNPESAFNPRARIGDVLARRVRLFEGAADMTARLARLLAEVGLPVSYLERRPSQLSGGEKQRLAIARALIGDPRLLVCDEIVSALDVETQARIVQLIARLQRDRGLSTIFISHDLSVVAALADRIAVLQHGRLVEMGPSRAIMAGGRHAYTKLLIDTAFAEAPRELQAAARE